MSNCEFGREVKAQRNELDVLQARIDALEYLLETTITQFNQERRQNALARGRHDSLEGYAP